MLPWSVSSVACMVCRQVPLTIPYQVHLKNRHPGTLLGIAIAKVQVAELRKIQNLVFLLWRATYRSSYRAVSAFRRQLSAERPESFLFTCSLRPRLPSWPTTISVFFSVRTDAVKTLTIRRTSLERPHKVTNTKQASIHSRPTLLLFITFKQVTPWSTHDRSS